jgi:hypothetical protein
MNIIPFSERDSVSRSAIEAVLTPEMLRVIDLRSICVNLCSSVVKVFA